MNWPIRLGDRKSSAEACGESGTRSKTESEMSMKSKSRFELLGFGRKASERLELGGFRIVFDSEVLMYVGEA